YVAHLQLLADDLEKHLDQVRTRLSETETSLSVVRQESASKRNARAFACSGSWRKRCTTSHPTWTAAAGMTAP
ncbi:unnamed protein product, partial [Effrenium voratum]